MQHWWKDAPPWLREVFAEMQGEASPVRWFSEATSRKQAEALRERWQDQGGPGYAVAPAVREACAARAARAVPLAAGPRRVTRLSPIEREVQLYADPARPEQLWAGLGEDFPAVLWVPAGASREAMEAALAPYTGAGMPRRLALEGVARGLVGSARGEAASARDLENHFAFVPTVDAPTWGSDYDDDPWPAEIHGPVNMLAQSVLLRQHMAQRPGRVPSTSWRTLWSRSILSLEQHPGDLFAIELRYRPSRHPEVIEEVSRLLGLPGARWPEDLPLDVAAALLGSPFQQAEELTEALRDPAQAEDAPFLLLALAALRHGELGVAALLREHARSGDLRRRAAAAIAADRLGYTMLLHEMCAAEPDEELRRQIEARAAFGPSQDDGGHDGEGGAGGDGSGAGGQGVIDEESGA